MWGKSFERDKNYILRQAQIDSHENLVRAAISVTLENYQLLHNPLGLKDDFLQKLKSEQNINYSFLKKSYVLLADIYRLLYSDNQLEFLWDGTSHHQKYSMEWSQKYLEWQNHLGKTDPQYSRIIIKGCYLHENHSNALLAASLEKIILKEFDIRKSRRGIIAVAA